VGDADAEENIKCVGIGKGWNSYFQINPCGIR